MQRPFIIVAILISLTAPSTGAASEPLAAPGYGWLFTTLKDAGSGQLGEPARTRVRRPTSPEEAATRLEMQRLRLKVAERLCHASDYADQAEGIHQKALALSELAALGDWLRPAERALLQRLQDEHRRQFQAFPRAWNAVVLTRSGVTFSGTPKPDTVPNTWSGWWVQVSPSGATLMANRMR